MRLDSLRIRLGLMGAGILTLAFFLAMGGHLGAPTTGSIVIQYGMYPREFEGLSVEIDGQVAGVLKPFGSAMMTGFKVAEGAHDVRVLHPRMRSDVRHVEVVMGRPAVLILDIGDHTARDGTSEPVVTFTG